MNEAILPSVKPSAPPPVPGVYADMGELVRLRFKSRGISLLPAQPLNSVLAGKHASRLRGRGLNFEEIRRYLPGDDVRQMDWKVTARTRTPHIRVYTEERAREVVLVVDQRLSMFFGSRKNFKSVTAAETAALSAWRVIAAKDRVSGIVFGDSDLTVVPSGGSPPQVMRLLSAVVERNRSLGIDRGIVPGPQMLNTALSRAERLVAHEALVVLISDGQGSDEETRAILSRIAAHNDVVVALVHDPLEGELPTAGNRVFASGGLQLEVDTSDAALRETFREDFQKHLETARRYLLQREVPLLPVSTASDVAPQIRRLLGTRVRR
ncbi:DUF58 domain-containing protein [Luteolibacter yonseiensis]|uniref:DUF58 domain-containing protein n=1 Tax=Luteolibacter yonseiensis TaxID=1144680 RepID=A0A934R073_9BACT|nr:DUF58 domain-containing protein [Luteolibacter yonseiensis]MBK1814082.1 DUF58 domain-containing protein [Luteolibacter yonseiensis]